MNIPSCQPELGNVFSLSRFKGFYCFTGLVACVDLDGLPFWKVEVCDYQNSLIVYCRNLENLIPRFYPFCFLQIEVKMSRVNGYIYPVMDHIDISNAIPSHCCHLHMLPYKAAYQLNDFNQLIELGRYITIPALATFIAQALMNQAVMLPFLRNPASKQTTPSCLPWWITTTQHRCRLQISATPRFNQRRTRTNDYWWPFS